MLKPGSGKTTSKIVYAFESMFSLVKILTFVFTSVVLSMLVSLVSFGSFSSSIFVESSSKVSVKSSVNVLYFC